MKGTGRGKRHWEDKGCLCGHDDIICLIGLSRSWRWPLPTVQRHRCRVVTKRLLGSPLEEVSSRGGNRIGSWREKQLRIKLAPSLPVVTLMPLLDGSYQVQHSHNLTENKKSGSMSRTGQILCLVHHTVNRDFYVSSSVVPTTRGPQSSCSIIP
jgi:hypothetical protein